MHKGMYVAASGFIASEKRLETITNNLANMNTAGFKADRMVFQSYLAGAKGQPSGVSTPANPNPAYMRQSEFVIPSEQYTDHSAGPVKPTGNPLDLTLTGDGFFAVMTSNGERYARSGSFHVGPNGELVTANGAVVLNDQNRSIIVGSGTINIDENGVIRSQSDSGGDPSGDPAMNDADGGRDLGKLKIVDFGKPYTLKKEGGGLFSASDPNEAIKPQDTKVMQGHLEQSNVNMIMEMTELIKNQRLAETYQKVITEHDNMTDRLIVNVGR
jgi:flagellar basal-body rod protein FlgG